MYFFKLVYLRDSEGKYLRLFSSKDLIWRSAKHISTAILCAVIFLLSRVIFNRSQLYSNLSIDISSKKSPLYEGKYSLGNSSRLPIDYEFMMKYLWQGIVTKISGFRMFSSTPLFQRHQKPHTQALYNPHNYCKIFTSGGLAQRVKQRTLKILLREWIDPVSHPCNTSKQSFSSVNFSKHT